MSATEQLVRWLDTPVRYWSVAWTALLLGIALTVILPCFLRRDPAKRFSAAAVLAHPITFFFFAAVILLAFRWPPLFFPRSFGGDEAQMLTEALTLLHDPLYPRALLGIGPIQNYVIMLPGLLGIDLDYVNGRLIALFLIWLSCLVLFFAIRRISGDLAARITVLAAIVCYSCARGRDFLLLSTEYVPSLALIAACLLFLRLTQRESRWPWLILYGLGVLLGSVPFSKLQAVPIAFVIAGFGFVHVLFVEALPLRERLSRAVIFGLGGVTVPILVVAFFAVLGRFESFLAFYIQTPLNYVQEGDPFLKSYRYYLGSVSEREPAYEALLIGITAFALVRLTTWAAFATHRKSRPWYQAAFAAAVLGASIYAVITPGRPFPHYLLLTIIPLCLFAGILMAATATATTSGEPVDDEGDTPAPAFGFNRSSLTGGILVLLPVIGIALKPIVTGVQGASQFIGNVNEYLDLPPLPASDAILKLKKPGDSLAVWGWFSEYNVETQLPMGMLLAVSEFLIEDTPRRDHFRKVNLEAFKRRKSAFFVDAVGPRSLRYKDPAEFGIDVFPELAAYVRANYTQLIDVTEGREVVARIYLLKERLREPSSIEEVKKLLETK